MTERQERKHVGRADILHILGIVAFWRWLTRNEIKFVTVHGVMNSNDASWRPLRWQLEEDTLREYLNILVDQYEFIEPREALGMLEGSIPRRKNCALFTIDDGYRNALTSAIPVLREFGIKPLIFVATGLIGSDSLFWFDRLDIALQSTYKSVNDIALGQELIKVDSGSFSDLRDSCRRIIYRSRELFDNEVDRLAAMNDLIENLYRIAGKSEDITEDIQERVGLLSHEQLLGCVDAGAEIGSHTVTHVRLPFVTNERIEKELRNSKADLEKWLQSECAIFCYPEGSTNARTASLVRRAGYRVAFAVSSEGRIFNQDIMALHRMHLPHKSSRNELLCAVCGLSDAMHELKRRLVSLFAGRVAGRSDQSHIRNTG